MKTIKKMVTITTFLTIAINAIALNNSSNNTQNNSNNGYYIVYGFEYIGYYDPKLESSSVVISDVIKIEECGQVIGELKDNFSKYYEKNYYEKRKKTLRELTVESFKSKEDALAKKKKIIANSESDGGHKALILNFFSFSCN